MKLALKMPTITLPSIPRHWIVPNWQQEISAFCEHKARLKCEHISDNRVSPKNV